MTRRITSSSTRQAGDVDEVSSFFNERGASKSQAQLTPPQIEALLRERQLPAIPTGKGAGLRISADELVEGVRMSEARSAAFGASTVAALTQSCCEEHPDPVAQFNLGSLLIRGYVVPKNEGLGEQLLSRAEGRGLGSVLQARKRIEELPSPLAFGGGHLSNSEIAKILVELNTLKPFKELRPALATRIQTLRSDLTGPNQLSHTIPFVLGGDFALLSGERRLLMALTLRATEVRLYDLRDTNELNRLIAAFSGIVLRSDDSNSPHQNGAKQRSASASDMPKASQKRSTAAQGDSRDKSSKSKVSRRS